MQSKEYIAGCQWLIRRFNWSWKADPEREGIHMLHCTTLTLTILQHVLCCLLTSYNSARDVNVKTLLSLIYLPQEFL